MTRKDYVALADALARARKMCETDNQRRGVERAMHYVADALSSDNARFDRQRFYRACDR